jgi:hypothetical protein
MINFRKTIAVGLAVTTLGAGIAATSTPAAAGGYYPGWGWGLGGVAAGSAIGAAAAASSGPYYNYGYGYHSCGFARQPVVDGWGNIVGYHRVRVCN